MGQSKNDCILIKNLYKSRGYKVKKYSGHPNCSEVQEQQQKAEQFANG